MMRPRKVLQSPCRRLMAAFSFALAVPAAKGAVSQTEIEKAVAVLRQIRPEEMTEGERETKAKDIDGAWKIIQSAGQTGLARLKAELRKVEAAGDKDDYFKLNASALLWVIGGPDEAAAITRIWDSTPLGVQYNYVFYTAFEAAMTQDERVVPMLKACLKDKEGRIFVVQHYLEVKWPRTHQFLWWAYGPKGLPVLEEVLSQSRDSVERRSAMILLSKAHHLNALPIIRKLAETLSGEDRCVAAECLGEYGHPQDFDFLVSGLRSTEPGYVGSCVFALREYGDLRAVSHIAPLAKSEDVSVRREAIMALSTFPAPASIEALHEHSEAGEDEEEKDACRSIVDGMLEQVGADWDAYSKASEAKRREMMTSLRSSTEGEFRLSEDDRRLTHDELLEAAAEWEENNRITGGAYEWVYERHVLSAATPDDIGLLLEVKASVCRRLSDECLYEVETLDGLIRRLGRSRYRKDVGLCDRAEAP